MRIHGVGCALALATTGANAAVVQFLATSGDVLMRADSSGATFASSILSDRIVGMTVAPSNGLIAGVGKGDILAISAVSDPLTGRFTLYRLDDPFGAATLVPVGSTDRNLTSLAFATGRLFGVRPNGDVREIDLVTGNTTLASSIGGPGAGFGGLQFDTGLGHFVSSTAGDDSLYNMTSPGPGAHVGALGVNFNNSGIEFLNGTLYGAFDVENSDEYVFGSIDLGTGAFTQLAKIDVAGSNTGFVAIPAPGAAVLLGLGSLAAVRRRR